MSRKNATLFRWYPKNSSKSVELDDESVEVSLLVPPQNCINFCSGYTTDFAWSCDSSVSSSNIDYKTGRHVIPCIHFFVVLQRNMECKDRIH